MGAIVSQIFLCQNEKLYKTFKWRQTVALIYDTEKWQIETNPYQYILRDKTKPYIIRGEIHYSPIGYFKTPQAAAMRIAQFESIKARDLISFAQQMEGMYDKVQKDITEWKEFEAWKHDKKYSL